MKRSLQIVSIFLGLAFLIGCGSMHPPDTDPYFAGYHARSPEEVEEEFHEWKVEQEQRQRRAEIQDSLRAVQDSIYSEYYKEFGLQRPHVYNNYNFYGGYNYHRPYYRYPYYSRWHRPYYSSWWHRSYYPHRYRSSGFSFSFSYSNMPWYVNTWWADDYLWDRYFWGDPYYDYWPYHSGYYPYGYSGYYTGRYYRPYYRSWYGDGWHRVVIDEQSSSQTQRPRDRERYSRVRDNGSTPTSPSSVSQPAREDVRERVGQRRSRITPSVIDRERIQERYPRVWERARSSRQHAVPKSGESSGSSEARPSDRRRSREVRGSDSNSHKSTSSGRSVSQRRSSSSSGSARSSSGGSSGKSSSSRSQRPRDRKRR